MKKTAPILALTGSDKSPAPIPGELCPDELARIHNGGPAGATKQATKKYWEKVKKFL
jgi:hypothetical protein